MSDLPTRCIDPIVKYCQECPYGFFAYPSLDETFCILGYDKGRPEDLPTEEERKEFEELCNYWYYNNKESL